MTHAIDASFRLRKEAAEARRRRQLRRRLGLAAGLLILAAVGTGFFLTRDEWSFGDEDEDLVAVDVAEDLPADAAVYVPAVVDLAGDPMWINLARDAGAAAKTRKVVRPPELDQIGISSQIQYLSDALVSSSEEFMTTIPSSQEDFAFFQAQRSIVSPAASSTSSDVEDSPDESIDMVPIEAQGDQPAPDADLGNDAAAGWGETIDAGEQALPAFQKTQVENNVTVTNVVDEAERFEQTQDTFLKILTNRTLESVVLETGFSADDAKLATDMLKTLFNLDTLEPGYVVAMRGFRANAKLATPSLMQVSIYAKSRFVGTLARNSAGVFVSGVDPWVSKDLFNYSGLPDEGGHRRQYRLLDAIYSTAARNNVPTGVIGEAIMYLSRGEDLNTFAASDQKLVLIYSDTARGKDGLAGRVLYAGVTGTDKNIECYVFQQPDGGFSCVGGNDQVHSLSSASGMVTPVHGVLTSTFGPRMHPILKTIRIHKGVDWAAPVGTPIVAAFDGQIIFEGDGGGYGNVIKIAHANNRETRYAHMSRFADGKPVGTQVKAGDTIGYIGTTGLSTGPHLHFELYLNGEAIDPLGNVSAPAVVASSTTITTPTATTTVTVAVSSQSEDAAVEILTNRIIHVESGGKARAKNPLSSATGLGQFIKSTWIRMMNTYRPDLARSLSTQQLLDLRYDPTISREMVQNLAREGEAYLKQRGHQITAGRLYLCHFLGMEGAHLILAASSSSPIVSVLGPGVISANPFLTGKDAGYVVNWAERKMNSRVSVVATTPDQQQQQNTPAPPPVVQTSPEFEKFKVAMSEIIASMKDTL